MLANNLQDGVRGLLQASGVSKLKPNVLMLGFREEWAKQGAEEQTRDYIQTIRETFLLNKSVLLVRRWNQWNHLDVTGITHPLTVL